MEHRVKMNCDVCNLEFKSKSIFKQHQMIHKEESFKCPHCDNAYKHQKHRDNHVESKHKSGLVGKASVAKKLNFGEECESFPKGNVRNNFVSPNNFKTPRKERRSPKQETKRTPKKELKTPEGMQKIPKTPKAKEPLKMSQSAEISKPQNYNDVLKLIEERSSEKIGLAAGPSFLPTRNKMEKHPSFDDIFPKSQLGSFKPKQVAHVKPQVKEEVFKDSNNKIDRVTKDSSKLINPQGLGSQHQFNLKQRDQSEDDRFKCEECEVEFEAIWEIKSHFIGVHNSEQMYLDYKRKRKQKTQLLMKQARLSRNDEGKTYLSAVQENSSLSEATKDAQKVVTYPCQLCDERFRSLKNLRKHESAHEENNERAEEQETLKLPDTDSSISSDTKTPRKKKSFDEKANSNTTSQEVKTPRKRRENACKECSNCKAEDCGLCSHCKDKPRFGGPGKVKQKCLRRICLKTEITDQKRKMLQMLEREMKSKIAKKNDTKKVILTQVRATDEVNEGMDSMVKDTDDHKQKETEEDDGVAAYGSGIKLKIKLKQSDSPETWASEVIMSKDSTKKRRNQDFELNKNDKKIRNDTEKEFKKYETRKQVRNDMHLKQLQDPSKDDVNLLMQQEVQEIIKLQGDFHDLLGDVGSNTGNESLQTLVPKTPKKLLDDTVEKLRNRIESNSFRTDEKTYILKEQDMDKLLESPKTGMYSNSMSGGSEKLLEETVAFSQKDSGSVKCDKDNGAENLDKSKAGRVITLYPESMVEPDVDPDTQVEKFMKLKNISTDLLAGNLSMVQASSHTGLGLPMLRCWLETLQHVMQNL